MASVCSHEASSSSTPRYTFQVFLSFRGEDTRKAFTDHLYTALVGAGFETFRDHEELERGEDINSELTKAIRHSELSVVVFSKGYASSRWCLDELAYILECRREGHMVLPVFYDIDPSHVRKQTGTFKEAFVQHEKRFNLDRVERWRAALRQAADLSGMDLQNYANRHEAEFIKEIINEIQKKLDPSELSIAEDVLIGIGSRVKDIVLWLKDGSTDIAIGVICGMGGVGKTTIATIAYNLNIREFEGCSFLSEINRNDLVKLQSQLLSDITKRKNININNVAEGITKIQNALCHKRVLVVLDGIDHQDQLKKILGMRNWFYRGSKIIITTRLTREGLALKAHEACKVFKVDELNASESLELFSWHAFGQPKPIDQGDMEEHSRSIVRQCGGLPLALKVLGSSLYNTSVEDFESASQLLEKIVDGDILKILKISYDSQNDNDKNIFLDIACFFVGKNKDYTITILKGCDFCTIGILNLERRCLITIDEDNKIRMHQLLQQMGRQIVCQESKCPGKRSRLWDQYAFSVLREKWGPCFQGTDAIEGLMDMPKVGDTASQESFSTPNVEDLSIDAFAMMYRLRLLSLDSVRVTGGYENFPKGIIWLCWRGFPLKFIPTNFCLENLVVLEMRKSSLKYLWKGTKNLKKLKILDLSYSYDLSETPDLSELTSLKRLMLGYCKSLVKVHESIGALGDCLLFLSLEGCENLRKLPPKFGMLKSLKELILSGCSKLELESLRTLNVDGTAINPSANSWFSNITCWVSEILHQEKTSFSLAFLPQCLVSLSIAGCNLPDIVIPSDFSLPSLRHLDLSENPICSLPDQSLNRLPKLEYLDINKCESLESLPKLPTSLRWLDASHCKSLETMNNLPNWFNAHKLNFQVKGCRKLVEVQDLFKLEPIRNIDPALMNSLVLADLESIGSIRVDMENIFTNNRSNMSLQGLYEYGIFSIFLPGSEVPYLSSNMSMGDTISMEIPLLPNCKIQGLNIYVLYERLQEDYFGNSLRTIDVRNATKGCKWTYISTFFGYPKVGEEMIWLSHWKFQEKLEGGDEVIVSACIDDYIFKQKKIGIHVVYEQEVDQIIRPHTSPLVHNVVDGEENSIYEISAGTYCLSRHNKFMVSHNWFFPKSFIPELLSDESTVEISPQGVPGCLSLDYSTLWEKLVAGTSDSVSSQKFDDVYLDGGGVVTGQGSDLYLTAVKSFRKKLGRSQDTNSIRCLHTETARYHDWIMDIISRETLVRGPPILSDLPRTITAQDLDAASPRGMLPRIPRETLERRPPILSDLPRTITAQDLDAASPPGMFPRIPRETLERRPSILSDLPRTITAQDLDAASPPGMFPRILSDLPRTIITAQDLDAALSAAADHARMEEEEFGSGW